MKKILPGLLVGLVLGSAATWLLMRPATPPTAPAADAAAKPAEEKPNPLRLPKAKREQAGIALARPAATDLAPEAHGFGRVLDATAFATALSEVETARAASEASEKELERARKLFAAEGNMSAQSVETAQAAATRDRAALAAAQARLAATWGRELARQADAIARSLEQGAALARIDVLPGDTPATNPKEARVALAGRSGEFSAEILGPAPVADPQLAGASFLALIRSGSLPAGAALRATLPAAGETAHGLVVPRTAVVYHQGSAWIFVLGEEDTFERKLVTLGRGVGPDAIAVLAGLEADEQVATTGAQQLLAAELQAGGAAEP